MSLKKRSRVVTGLIGLGSFCILCMCLVLVADSLGFIPDPTPTGPARALGLASGEGESSTPMPTETTAPTQTAEPPTPTGPPVSTATQMITEAPRADLSLASMEGAVCIPVGGEVSTGVVTRVIDGDTIEVEIDGFRDRVRYIGMDAPEGVELGEPLAAEATAKNRELVEGREVVLVKDVSNRDPFDRLLRYVLVGDTFVNYALVKEGFASQATYPPDTACAEVFRQAEEAARAAGLGLWAAGLAVETQPAASAPSVSASVVISYIFYDGVVPRVESDEYAEITNQGSEAVNLGGWILNAGAPIQNFRFPDFQLEPGETIRVYTNEVHPESGGFSFRSEDALWNNKGDCGYLRDGQGNLVSEYCY